MVAVSLYPAAGVKRRNKMPRTENAASSKGAVKDRLPHRVDLTPLEDAINERQGKREGDEIRFICPAHDDHNPSARWNHDKEAWHCDACKAGGGFKDLASLLGITLNGQARVKASAGRAKSKVVATYDYYDANAALLFQVERLEPKSFRQRHVCPDAPGGFTYGLGKNDKCKCDPITPVIYRLPEVLEQIDTGGAVYLCEGEKDVHRLEALGKVATCNPMGAGKWHEDYARALEGAHLTLIPDNDEVGHKHMRDIALSVKAKSIRVLLLDGLAPKGDVTDWLETHNADDFAEAVKEAPVWLAAGNEAISEFVNRVFVGFVGSPSDNDDENEEPWEDMAELPERTPPAPSLPESLIPDPLRPWLVDISDRASIPLEMPAAAAVVALGATTARRVGIYPKQHDDWLVIPNLWGGVVGRPGLLKSTVISEATKPLRRLEAQAHEDFQADHANNEAYKERLKLELEALKSDMKTALRANGKGNPDTIQADMAAKQAELEGATITAKRYTTQDATVEKLGELLQENPNGLMVLRDELAGFLKTLERPGREGDREFYLESWNGSGSYTFDRIGRGTVRVPAVCLSILGGIQPGKLRGYIEEALRGGDGADGLLQRLQLVVWPEHLEEFKNVDEYPNREAANRAYEIFKVLAKLDPETLSLPTQEKSDIPGLHFTAKAQAVFNDWRLDLEQRLRSKELNSTPAFESHLSKYRSLMPSLALIFHLVTWAAGDTETLGVSEEATRLAAAWCEYLELHAKRIYARETNAPVIAAHELLDKIDDGAIKDGEQVRRIYRKGWEALADKETVTAGLEVLAKHNYLKVKTVETGGRPSLVVKLHPELKANHE